MRVRQRPSANERENRTDVICRAGALFCHYCSPGEAACEPRHGGAMRKEEDNVLLLPVL